MDDVAASSQVCFIECGVIVNREEEINIAKGIMGMRFKDTAEICAVVGGIGVGKSSTLYYIANIAKENGYNAEFYDNPDDFYSEDKNIKEKDSVSIIDNVDKLDDENARKYYNFIEKHVSKLGGIIFKSESDYSIRRQRNPVTTVYNPDPKTTCSHRR